MLKGKNGEFLSRQQIREFARANKTRMDAEARQALPIEINPDSPELRDHLSKVFGDPKDWHWTFKILMTHLASLQTENPKYLETNLDLVRSGFAYLTRQAEKVTEAKQAKE